MDFKIITLLMLVAVLGSTLGLNNNRPCNPSDVSLEMIHQSGSVFDININVAKAFVEIQGPPNSDINVRNRNGNNPFHHKNSRIELASGDVRHGVQVLLDKTDHHVIDWQRIGSELYALKEEIQKQNNLKMYEKVRVGLNRLIGTNLYKSKTWHIAIKKLINSIKGECRTGKLLQDAIHEVALQLNYMIRWTPNNLYLGPASSIRADDPTDMGIEIDIPILRTLKRDQQAKFKIVSDLPLFNYKVSPKWFTIVELLADIDEGPGFMGPVWEKLPTAPDPKKSLKVWRLNGKAGLKICYPDVVSRLTEGRCPNGDGKTYIIATNGRIVCTDRGPQSNPRFKSLCE